MSEDVPEAESRVSIVAPIIAIGDSEVVLVVRSDKAETKQVLHSIF